MKKPVDVEKLLQWAFRDELPKKGVVGELASSWEPLIGAGMPVDDAFGDNRLPAALGAPHPDALVIERAVDALPGGELLDWDHYRRAILADYWLFEEARRFVSNLVFDMGEIVAAFARLGARPAWNCEQPVATRIIGPNGKPVIVGIDGNRHYRRGAYCPLRLDPPLARLAVSRAEYLVWRTGLDRVRESLSGQLCDHEAIETSAPGEPWFAGVEKSPRVIPSLLPAVLTPLSVKRPSRNRATVKASA